ncbi:RecQ mediated genome instability protein Rmi1 [Schizosaccharomyces osmophilus]|uniref:RecQ-mediated genome instability protein 1 n=1 Tax=Schizosaccharomyces osmophilus TaxID=2545709 RepID=A0AAF0AUQ2_9SCHI|nr:RecQ mediated genome instability protein Rmi1 [Schizosaccharomyces osmophilus]WBW71583.1 RecQ mediated genome instability protein Rmi1 [Schizosaccharomyces osmophilus]
MTDTMLLREMEQRGIPLQDSWLLLVVNHLVHQRKYARENITTELVFPFFMASDIRTSTSGAGAAAYDISSQHNITLSNPLLVQVVRIREIGKSIVSQLEYLNQLEERKNLKGQQIIRLVDEEDQEDKEGDDSGIAEAQEAIFDGKGFKYMCRLVLEDANGQRFYGMEWKPIPGIQLDTDLGTKLVIHNAQEGRLMNGTENTFRRNYCKN